MLTTLYELAIHNSIGSSMEHKSFCENLKTDLETMNLILLALLCLSVILALVHWFEFTVSGIL